MENSDVPPRPLFCFVYYNRHTANPLKKLRTHMETPSKSHAHFFLSYFVWFRVVPSVIPNLERKHSQYQDSGFVRAKRSLETLILADCLKRTTCGFVTFVTCLRF